MKEFDRTRIKILPLSQRENKIRLDVMIPVDLLPEKINVPNLYFLAKDIIKARKEGREVVWMMGAHPIRRGNSLIIIDLMKRGIITHLATGGAGAIHDFEFAYQGATCEDVERYIKDGRFGNWDATGYWINYAAKKASENDKGFGETLGEIIKEKFNFAGKVSIFSAACELNIPITIHKGIGFDITDQSNFADFGSLGKASGKDFLIFSASIERMVERGGVFLNVGSAVMGPEVFLKSLSMARNALINEGKKICSFVTANFDLIDSDLICEGKPDEASYYYRPKKTVLFRSVKDGGKSYSIVGDFRKTIPNLYQLLKTEVGSEGYENCKKESDG